MLTLKSHAKINLTLEIISKRPDGYHNIESVMQEIELHDKIILRKARGIKIRSNKDIPLDENNPAWKATESLMQDCGVEGAEITIIKNIPVAAGLGGGSSNATTVLKGLNNIYDLKLKTEDLLRHAEDIGCDVPFFILGKTALATDKGETVKRLNDLPKTRLILINPRFEVHTKEIYENFRNLGSKNKTKEFVKNPSFKNLYNDFEELVFERYPVLKEIKETLTLDERIEAAAMTGTGPTIYGIIKQDMKLQSKKYKKFGDVYFTYTI